MPEKSNFPLPRVDDALFGAWKATVKKGRKKHRSLVADTRILCGV